MQPHSCMGVDKHKAAIVTLVQVRMRMQGAVPTAEVIARLALELKLAHGIDWHACCAAILLKMKISKGALLTPLMLDHLAPALDLPTGSNWEACRAVLKAMIKAKLPKHVVTVSAESHA